MMWTLLLLLLISGLLTVVRGSSSPSPVIGILTQPTLNGTNNYIAASYVKWLEAGGARSIPILYDETNTTKLADILSQIDGILLPGGASEMPTSVNFLLDNAPRYGHPVWGTCLGFEYLIQYVGGTDALQNGFVAENISLPLENVIPFNLYIDPFIQGIVQKDITMNNHHQGITVEQFKANSKLSSFWQITSVSHDKNGRRFVSTIEPRDSSRKLYYGVQFHPEKNSFEYSTYPHTNIPYEAIDHSDAGIQFSLYLARFFVNLARQNQRSTSRYSKPDEYPLVNTYPMKRGYKFEQVYILPVADKEDEESSTTIRSFLRHSTN